MLKQIDELLFNNFELHIKRDLNQICVTISNEDGLSELVYLPMSDHLSKIPNYIEYMIESLKEKEKIGK